MKSKVGDLGVRSGPIATNSKELAALKALGDRRYFEFKIAKVTVAVKVGDIFVRLLSTDPKHNEYTIQVLFNDKTIEKKDKSVNEPVQILLPKVAEPYELVVNEVRKDMILGYLASPKMRGTPP
jgi:hypothetical protein